MKNSWPVKKLGEVLSEISDGNYSSKYPRSQDFVTQGVPFIRAINFKNGKLVWDDMRYISSEKHKELKKGHLKTDDVLITTRGEIGTIAYVTSEFNDANINAQIVRLQANPASIIPSFLFYLFTSYYVKNQLYRITTGSTLKQLSVQNLHLIQVQIPSIFVQKKIVERLDAIRKAQELIDLQIQKTEELFESVISKEFEVLDSDLKYIKDVSTKITKGTTPTTYGHRFADTGVPFLRVEDIINEELDYKNTKYCITEYTNKLLSRSQTQANDVLITIAGTIGRTTRVPIDAPVLNMNQAVAIIRPSVLILPDFLVLILRSKAVYNQILKSKVTGTLTNLSLSQLGNLEIPVPTLNDQEEIVEKLEAIQEYKKLLQKQKQLYKELFDSVLDKSMKGEL